MTNKPGVPHWSREPLLTRLHRCRAMLSIHGVLTDAEDRRVRRRLEREEPPSLVEPAETTAVDVSTSDVRVGQR